jgi:hypothetical protein
VSEAAGPGKAHCGHSMGSSTLSPGGPEPDAQGTMSAILLRHCGAYYKAQEKPTLDHVELSNSRTDFSGNATVFEALQPNGTSYVVSLSLPS